MTSYKANKADKRNVQAAQAKEKKETVADRNELETTTLGPVKGSTKVWNKTPDLQHTMLEVDDRLCLPKAVCSLIKDNKLTRAAFYEMAKITPTGSAMQLMHVNKALLTHGVVLRGPNSDFLSKKSRPVYTTSSKRSPARAWSV